MTNMNKVYHIFALVFMFAFSQQIIAQSRYFDERYITTQHFMNPVLINPGDVGSSDYHRLIANYRNNWASFPGAPKTFLLSYDGPIGKKIGFGLSALSDKSGGLRTTKGQGSVSYTLNTANNRIGFGLSGEFLNHGISNSLLLDPLNESNDEVVLSRADGVSFFDVSFGISGLYDNTISYGLVFPSMVSTRLDEREESFDKEFSYIFHLGYKWQFEGYDFSVEPSVFLKQLAYVPFHADINVKALFLEERLMGGVSYTVGADERLGFLIGSRVNSFNFYYSYNLSRNDFQSYNNGAHELTVRFDLGRKDIKPAMIDMESDSVKESQETIQEGIQN